MTFKPMHWKSHCDFNRGGWHIWMCYSHNKGWKQLGVFCIRCGTRSYMSDRQWLIYANAKAKADMDALPSESRQ